MDPLTNSLAATGDATTLTSAGAATGNIGSTALPAATGTAGAGAAFSNTLVNAVGSLSGLQTNADAAVAGVAEGSGTDIHQAMIAMQQASLGINLAVQVRNKAVEAYQSLMNMQM